jgi:protein SPT2
MTKIGDLLAQITGEPSPTQATIPIPPKRKASESEPLRRPADKLQRTNSGSLATANSSWPINPSNRPSGVDTSMSKMKLGSSGNGNGNGRTLTSTASSTFKNGQPTPPPTTDGGPSKPPKKGSFAEIMARGKAVQATRGGQVGKIQHKRIEKLPSKREREEMKMQKGAQIQKNLGPNGKFRNGTPTGANGRMQAGNGTKGGKPTEPEKKVKKAALATTGYAGTARPKPGASSRAGSSRAGPSSRPTQSSKQRYTYASEEEEEEEIDEQEDYASDGSSDMEAAAFEVDEEEEFAARAARKEDAEALAEENRLKREKEAKKRRLMAMAAKRR